MDESNNDIALISTALQNFDKVSAGLAILEKNYKGVVFDVETEIGMQHAKASRSAVREPRYEIERVRKSAKAPLLALGKRLDSEAQRITTALLSLEDPIDEQIKSEESRLERERLARLKVEEDRKIAIHTRIAEMRGAVGVVERYRADSNTIKGHIDDIEKTSIDESFAEFRAQAEDAKLATLTRLRELHTSAVQSEAERAELERLRAEHKAREDAAALVKAEADRVASEAQAAENARTSEANRIARERFEAEQAQARKLTAARQAELDAQQAEIDKQIVAERQKQADEANRLKEQQVQNDARAAAQKKAPPSLKEMELVLAEHYHVSVEMIHKWLTTKVSKSR